MALIACWDCPGSVGESPSAWLQYGYDNGYDNGYRPYLDALAYHPYAPGRGMSPSTPMCGSSNPRYWNLFGPADPACGELAATRAVMVRNGDAAKKIWGTEFGHPTADNEHPEWVRPPEVVRDVLVESVAMWRTAARRSPGAHSPAIIAACRSARWERRRRPPSCPVELDAGEIILAHQGVEVGTHAEAGFLGTGPRSRSWVSARTVSFSVRTAGYGECAVPDVVRLSPMSARLDLALAPLGVMAAPGAITASRASCNSRQDGDVRAIPRRRLAPD